jgi:tetratricopeptide (TPR) repeat protein
VAGIPELLERGIRAFLAGRERDALASFQEVLGKDPQNKKARWYLEKLRAAGVSIPEPARAPSPSATSPAAPPATPAPAPEPGPAPAPVQAQAQAQEPATPSEIDIALTPVPLADRAVELQPVRFAAPPAPVPPVAPPPAASVPPAPFAGAVPWPSPPAAPPPASLPPASPLPPPPAPFAAAVALPPSAGEALPPAGAVPPVRSEAARAAAHAVIAAALGVEEDAAAPVAAAPAAPAAWPAVPPAAPDVPGGRALDAAALPAAQDEYAPSPWDDGPAAPATIVLEPTGGLDLGAVEDKSDLRPLVPEGARPSPGPRNDVEVWLAAAKELFALGDFTGSLELIEKILQVDPDHGEARDYLRQNEATLISMYESKLGSLTRVPRLAIKPEEILWLNLDHRAGFLLAQIDGTVDYDSLFALSGLPRLDTARILANLIADGVIRS